MALTNEHYTSAEVAASMCKKDAALVRPEYLEWADAAIEERLGGGFKGAARVARIDGEGSELVFLPSNAAAITEVKQGDSVLPLTDFELWEDGAILERIAGVTAGVVWGTYSPPSFASGTRYKIAYTEPVIVPRRVQQCAAQLVSECVMWAIKNDQHGVATTSTRSGSSAGGSQAVTLSFPPGLDDAFTRILDNYFAASGAV
jgi:hypothetical protein